MKTFLTLLVTIAALVSSQAGHHLTTGTIYSSRAATALGKIQNKKVALVDTGLLPKNGGTRERERSPFNYQKGTIKADSGYSYISGETRLVFAENINENLVIQIGDNIIETSRVRTWALTGCCHSRISTLGGKAEFADLTINGTPIATGPANQVVPLNGGQVIINEHLPYLEESKATLEIHALHITLQGGTDVVIGFASVGVNCIGDKQPEHDECDFITGGGWIDGTPTGDRASFGVEGGEFDGRFWGGLNYIDHNSGMHVKSRTVTAYRVIDENTREIEFRVTIDGEPGTAFVEVTDNGEPGRDDTLFIRLSNGYEAGGTLGGENPGGGNIHLHQCHGRGGEHSH